MCGCEEQHDVIEIVWITFCSAVPKKIKWYFKNPDLFVDH